MTNAEAKAHELSSMADALLFQFAQRADRESEVLYQKARLFRSLSEKIGDARWVRFFERRPVTLDEVPNVPKGAA